MTSANYTDITCDRFADTLADFLERDVNEPTRAAMEAHALACAECGALLADLRKLRIDAANLPELVPSHDLWSGIAARIETPVVELPAAGRSGGRVGGRWRGGLTIGLAAAALIVITATVTHELTKRSIVASTVAGAPVVVKPSPAAGVTAPAESAPESAVVAQAPGRPAVRPPANVQPAARLASNTKPSVEETYDSEIRRLRTIVNRRRGDLDSATIAVIDKNLKIIDDAIAQCRLALRKDPNSRFLLESLNDALDSKVQLLQTAAALPTRM